MSGPLPASCAWYFPYSNLSPSLGARRKNLRLSKGYKIHPLSRWLYKSDKKLQKPSVNGQCQGFAGRGFQRISLISQQLVPHEE